MGRENGGVIYCLPVRRKAGCVKAGDAKGAER